MFNRRSFLVLVATSTLAACAAARETVTAKTLTTSDGRVPWR